MDNSFSKAMETVAGAIWSQLMLKGRAEVSVNGINLTTLSLDVHVQNEQLAARRRAPQCVAGLRRIAGPRRR